MEFEREYGFLPFSLFRVPFDTAPTGSYGRFLLGLLGRSPAILGWSSRRP